MKYRDRAELQFYIENLEPAEVAIIAVCVSEMTGGAKDIAFELMKIAHTPAGRGSGAELPPDAELLQLFRTTPEAHRRVWLQALLALVQDEDGARVDALLDTLRARLAH